MFRDIETNAKDKHHSRAGRNIIAVIGIDRYRRWPRLSNAVSDARGALNAFLRLGFEQVTEPLYEEVATAEAIRRLVTDDLARLNEDDSLVLFFAGHGHTVTQTFPGGDARKTGYIIPVDGDEPEATTGRWLRLDHWLSDVALLKVKHILVFLDACHSGIALGSLVKWRDGGRLTESLERLAERRSRRVITSALDDQRAMDSGPIPRHSLFTGCLIEGLDGGIAQHGELVTGTQIGLYLQKRVTSYPRSVQTPDFGALEEDRRGELVIRMPAPLVAKPIARPAAPDPASHDAASSPDTSGRTSDLALVEGARIGSYRIVRQLGRGGFGVVYVGVDVRLGRRAAIKQLLPERSGNREIVERFFNEAKAAANINHPGIVEIYDVGWHTDGSAYFAMKLLEGESLAQRLRTKGPMPVQLAATIGRQIASALVAAHALGIVHRDLKPDNIMLAPDEETATGERAMVLDFGIAKLFGGESPSQTRAGLVMGTPLYMSPEQCHGSSSVDHRTDVYALGCILFEMLGGRPPFIGDGAGAILGMHQFVMPPLLRSVRTDLSADIEAVVMHALAKQPEQRFQQMSDFAVALQPFGAGRSMAQAASSASDSADSPPPRAVSSPSVVVSELAYTPEPRLAGAASSSPTQHGATAVAAPLSMVSEARGEIVPNIPVSAPAAATTLGGATAQMMEPQAASPQPRRSTGLWTCLAAAVIAAGIGVGLLVSRSSGTATMAAKLSAPSPSESAAAPKPQEDPAGNEVCEAGHPKPCARLGMAYEMGHGKDRNFERALAAYLHGCDAGVGDACAGLGRLYRSGNGVRFEPTRAFAVNQKACQLRSAEGCFQVGEIYDTGASIPVDHSKALASYETACELGSARGCCAAGVTWTYWSFGGAIDPQKGKRFYQRGRENGTRNCDAGDVFACWVLGQLYAKGESVEADASRALVLFQRACELGETGSCASLGTMYERGVGIPMDRARALSLFRTACEGGDKASCAWLGDAYLRGLGVDKDEKRGIALLDDACLKGTCSIRARAYVEGLGGPADKSKGLELVQRSCDTGDGDSCALIGELVPARKAEMDQRSCDTGDPGGCLQLGIARWKAGDQKNAFTFFNQSCGMSGGLVGCNWLGSAYLNGEGTAKDEQRGLALINSACDRSDGGSCYDLAMLYARGEHVPASAGRAAELLDKACVLHDGEACRVLAGRYASGNGVTRDSARAAELLQTACTNGVRPACKK